MQRIVNIDGKNYPLQNEEFALRCLLGLITHSYKDIERFKKEDMRYVLAHTESYLQGLKAAYFYMTGKDISDDEIKELANNEYNEKHKNDKEDGQYKANLMNDPFLF